MDTRTNHEVKRITIRERERDVALNNKKRRKKTKRKYKRGSLNGWQRARIVAPQTLCLTNKSQFLNTAKFINDLSKCARINNRVHIDLSNLEYLVPCGAIYFMSSIERISQYGTVITGTYPKNKLTEQMLRKLGVLKLMGLSRPCSIDSEHVEDWRVLRGKEVTFGDDYDVVEELLKNSLGEDNSISVNSGISEAVSNVCTHGYSEREELRPWWGFVRKVEVSGNSVLYVVISDLGLGIHKTIPMSTMKKLGISVRQFATKLNILHPDKHSTKIKLACELGETQTKESHRGKGLPEMVNVTKMRESAWLSVISGKGLVTFRNKQSTKPMRITHADFPEAIKGTIICWQIPLV